MRFQCSHCQCILDIEDCEPGEMVVCGQCQAAVQVPMTPISPTAVLGDFVIIRDIGEGGMGKVYLAHQISLDRDVALKILSGKLAEDLSFIQNFINEARMAASLNHPNIVQAYAVNVDAGLYYFAMEFISGMTLKEILQKKKRLSAKEVLQIGIDIASALDYAWRERKMLHRDIKPDNIMITDDHCIKLADLGLAVRQTDEDQDGDQELYGTPQYIAPELLLNRRADVCSDMYSLGATLYQALTGQYPYNAADVNDLVLKHGQEPLPSIASIVQDGCPSLNTVIEILLSKRPYQRYSSFTDLLNDLKAVKEQNPIKGKLHLLSQAPLDFGADDPLALVGSGEKSSSGTSEGGACIPKKRKGAVVFVKKKLSRSSDANSSDDGTVLDHSFQKSGVSSEEESEKPEELDPLSELAGPSSKKSGKKWIGGILFLVVVFLFAGGIIGVVFFYKGAFWQHDKDAGGEQITSISNVQLELNRIKENIKSGSPEAEIMEQLWSVGRQLTSSSVDYSAYLAVASPYIERKMVSERASEIDALHAKWAEKNAEYEALKNQEQKDAEARAERKQIAEEKKAEQERVV
ncbi:MAG: serine/threonine-protein kinase, partial [Lentisphaeria bacterium]